MKSIISEGSSVAKAIEQSWKKTGKPQNFSVKVLEEEEKNFLGMTRKPAKIAFFFDEKSTTQRKTDQKYQTQQKRPQRQRQTSRQPQKSEKRERPLAKKQPTDKVRALRKTDTTPSRQTTARKQDTTLRKTTEAPDKKDALTATRRSTKKSPWTDQMIAEAKNWITGMLKEMNMSHVSFSVKPSGNNLKFHFEAPLIKAKEKQKALFRNFAFLIMQSMRYKFKKQFRNLKAVFTSN